MFHLLQIRNHCFHYWMWIKESIPESRKFKEEANLQQIRQKNKFLKLHLGIRTLCTSFSIFLSFYLSFLLLLTDPLSRCTFITREPASTWQGYQLFLVSRHHTAASSVLLVKIFVQSYSKQDHKCCLAVLNGSQIRFSERSEDLSCWQLRRKILVWYMIFEEHSLVQKNPFAQSYAHKYMHS